MHLKVDRGDIQGMQKKEMHMPKRTILREKP
jgi:hypothetical protein